MTASQASRHEVRYGVPPAEGVLMRRMRTGRDAAPAVRPRQPGFRGVSGVTARPNYVRPSARAGGADERRAKIPAGSRRPRERLLPFPEGGPRPRKNAAVKRRKARRPASWAGCSLPLEGPVSQGRTTGRGVPHQRLPALHPSSDWGHLPTVAGRPLPRNDGVWLDANNDEHPSLSWRIPFAFARFFAAGRSVREVIPRA